MPRAVTGTSKDSKDRSSLPTSNEKTAPTRTRQQPVPGSRSLTFEIIIICEAPSKDPAPERVLRFSFSDTATQDVRHNLKVFTPRVDHFEELVSILLQQCSFSLHRLDGTRRRFSCAMEVSRGVHIASSSHQSGHPRTDKVPRSDVDQELRVTLHEAGNKERAREGDEHWALLWPGRQRLDRRRRICELLLGVLKLLVVGDEALQFAAMTRGQRRGRSRGRKVAGLKDSQDKPIGE